MTYVSKFFSKTLLSQQNRTPFSEDKNQAKLCNWDLEHNTLAKNNFSFCRILQKSKSIWRILLKKLLNLQIQVYVLGNRLLAYIPNFCKLYRKKGTPYERNLHTVCTVVAYRLLFLRFLFQYPLERAYRPVI